MRALNGSASAEVPAPLPRCLALVRAVDRYPDWYPEVVREVEVLERDDAGEPSRVRAKLHMSQGPVVRDFDLELAVAVDPPATVRLTRVLPPGSDQTFDVTWHLDEARSTRIELELAAMLAVPRFLPLGGIGDAMASGFVTAASRALESS